MHSGYAPKPELVSALAARAGLERAAIELRELPKGPGPASVRVSLDSGAADDELSPASMIKVPIAAALAERWRDGELRPGGKVAIRPEDVTSNDAPSPLVSGYAASLEELGRLMLTRSDNVATNVLIRVLGRERISERCRAWGLARTAVRRKLSGSLPLIEDPGADRPQRSPRLRRRGALRAHRARAARRKRLASGRTVRPGVERQALRRPRAG